MVQKLDGKKAKQMKMTKKHYDEKLFRWEMNENQMALEKTADGIRKFAAGNRIPYLSFRYSEI